jgi:hypothetical protein
VRYASLLAVALLLPACDLHHHHHKNVEVHVSNTGTQDVTVDVETVNWDDDTLADTSSVVALGTTSVFTYRFDDVHRVKVKIYRVSDGFKIFDDFWDRDEVEDLNHRIFITVSP